MRGDGEGVCRFNPERVKDLRRCAGEAEGGCYGGFRGLIRWREENNYAKN